MTWLGRLIALGLVVAALFTVGIVVLVRSETPGCTIVAPRPSLSAALRALGDFDQGYDAGNASLLEDAATRAAGVTYADLIGVSAEAPVSVSAAVAGRPDAIVVPLRSHAVTSSGSPPLAGLVVFLRDCAGNAYFATVEDDSSTQPALLAFPPVNRDRAGSLLGAAEPHLEYTTSPLRPAWVATPGSAPSLAAR